MNPQRRLTLVVILLTVWVCPLTAQAPTAPIDPAMELQVLQLRVAALTDQVQQLLAQMTALAARTHQAEAQAKDVHASFQAYCRAKGLSGRYRVQADVTDPRAVKTVVECR